MNTPTTTKSRKNIMIIIAIMIILLIGGFFAYGFATKSFWPFVSTANNDTTSGSSSDINSVNYNPPSKEDKVESQDAKERNDKDTSTQDKESTNPPNPTGKKTVEVGVSFADIYEGNVEIRAFTPSVIEGNGTCTAKLSQGSQTIIRPSKVFVDSSSSQCEPIYVPIGDFPSKGVWKLTVTYDSPTSTGTSETLEIRL